MSEPIENSKLDTAIGIWKVPYLEIDIEYTIKDLRKLKRLIFKKREDRTMMYEEIADYLTDVLVPKYHPDYEKVKLYKTVEHNIMKIVENMMLTFRFSTKEDMQKAEEQLAKNQKEMMQSLV